MNTSRTLLAARLAIASIPLTLVSVPAEAALVAETAWVAQRGGSGIFLDLALSPDGATAFASGNSDGYAGLSAYSAADGTELWRFQSQRPSSADAVAVSPDGRTVVLAGSVSSPRYGAQLWAFDTSDGRSLWAKRIAGSQPGREDAFVDVAFPNGNSSAVYATGRISNEGNGTDLIAVSHAARNGSLRWKHVVDLGPTGGSRRLTVDEAGLAIDFAPNGSSVYVAGYGNSVGRDPYGQAMTVALRASDGARRWLAGSGGNVGSRRDPLRSQATDIEVDASGVFLGEWRGETFAGGTTPMSRLRHSNGSSIWRREGTAEEPPILDDLLLRDGALYAAGGQNAEFKLWSLGSAAGERRWVTDIQTGSIRDLDVVPDGSLLLGTGGYRIANDSFMSLVAVDPGTGEILWRHGHSPTGAADPSAHGQAMAVTPDGSRVVIAGVIDGAPAVIAVDLPDGTLASVPVVD